jgi:signal transduction histidine kinase
LECTNAPPSVPVCFNPRRLGRVFWNLVQNAVEAMPEGGAIRLRFECVGGQIATQFKDAGEGIPPEMGDRLFDPFATVGKPAGTGLGLAICRQIIEEHGGRILAGNGQDGGAIFTFTLPRAAA